MATLRQTPMRIGVVFVLLVLVVIGQTAAAAMAPSGSSAKTGRLIGRAGFAYLSGIRTFAAAVLWNRLEPQFHMYYANTRLKDNKQLLPTIRLVQTLDPQFVQAYYNAAWIVSEIGDTSTAFDLAREGIRNNPTSGLLRASYAQLMISEDNKSKNDEYLDQAVAQADEGTGPDTVWASEGDKFEGYAVFAAVYRIAGLKEKADAAAAVNESLKASLGGSGLGGAGHDHDGDGKPDH